MTLLMFWPTLLWLRRLIKRERGIPCDDIRILNVGNENLRPKANIRPTWNAITYTRTYSQWKTYLVESSPVTGVLFILKYPEIKGMWFNQTKQYQHLIELIKMTIIRFRKSIYFSKERMPQYNTPIGAAN